jgi:predicted phosphodiesterase
MGLAIGTAVISYIIDDKMDKKDKDFDPVKKDCRKILFNNFDIDEDSLISLLIRILKSLGKGIPLKTIDTDKKIIFVGDLHGSIASFKKIYAHYGNNVLYMITGDIIDRGKYSMEIYLFLFAMSIIYDNVVICRGNHETFTYQLCAKNVPTLTNQIMTKYYPKDKDIYMEFDCDCEKKCFCRRDQMILKLCNKYTILGLFYAIFSRLPYACHFTKQNILAIHGGFYKGMQSINDLSTLKMKMDPELHSKEHQVLWNDYQPLDIDFKKSRRNCGLVYGTKAVKEICGKTFLIRGHTHSRGGYELNDNVLTLFSSALRDRIGGFAVYENGTLSIYTFNLNVINIFDFKTGKQRRLRSKFKCMRRKKL